MAMRARTARDTEIGMALRASETSCGRAYFLKTKSR
jgi:hypothetical protein